MDKKLYDKLTKAADLALKGEYSCIAVCCAAGWEEMNKYGSTMSPDKDRELSTFDISDVCPFVEDLDAPARDIQPGAKEFRALLILMYRDSL